MGELYKLTFPNGKCYIGITTKRAKDRFHGHKARAKQNKASTPLYTAWRKHGEPTLCVLAILEDHALAETEIRAIAAFNTLHPNGYNASVGGDVSPMTIPEIAAKSAATRIGVPLSDSHKAALSAAQRGKPRPNLAKALKGKKASLETKKKMSESAKALVRSEEHIAKLRLSAEKARAAAAAKKVAS